MDRAINFWIYAGARRTHYFFASASTHVGHDVDAEAGDVGAPATKMEGQPDLQTDQGGGRHGNRLGVQVQECRFEQLQIGRLGQQGQIESATTPRCAVEHAGLAAH